MNSLGSVATAMSAWLLLLPILPAVVVAVAVAAVGEARCRAPNDSIDLKMKRVKYHFYFAIGTKFLPAEPVVDLALLRSLPRPPPHHLQGYPLTLGLGKWLISIILQQEMEHIVNDKLKLVYTT